LRDSPRQWVDEGRRTDNPLPEPGDHKLSPPVGTSAASGESLYNSGPHCGSAA